MLYRETHILSEELTDATLDSTQRTRMPCNDGSADSLCQMALADTGRADEKSVFASIDELAEVSAKMRARFILRD